jgi:uncharacterized protein YndB with AHSA1/START domain
MKNEPITLEKTLHAPVEVVWQALTSKDEMQNWYFDIKEFKPEVGFEFTFTAGDEHRKYLHRCKILTIEKFKKLSYTWSYDDYPGETIVTFELFKEGNTTRVKLTHEGTEKIQAGSDKNFARESFVGGWTHIIGTSLKNYVEKVTI